MNKSLSAIGSIIQYGISQIPVIGGLLNTIFGLLWPANGQDIWSTIKQEVQDLVNEDIDDEEWNTLITTLNQLQDQVRFINQQIQEKEYNTAGTELMTVVISNIGIEEHFKISGRTFKYAFAPLFVATINLKVALYLEGIKYSTELELSSSQVSQLKDMLLDDISGAKDYLKPINSDLESSHLNNLQDYINYSLYYGSSVSLFNALWSGDYIDYEQPTPLENYYIPVMAAGSFYKLLDLDGETLAVPMSFSEIVKNSMMPTTNILGALYQEPTTYPSGFINYIDVYTDLSTMHRTTGLLFTSSGSDQQYEMGMTPNNDYSFNVGQNIMNIDIASGDYLCNVSTMSSEFVSRITFTSHNGNTMVAGQNPDNDALQTISLVSPFAINSMYVVSDEAGYLESSGHQMCGIAISAIYNNQLAMQYVSSLYK